MLMISQESNTTTVNVNLRGQEIYYQLSTEVVAGWRMLTMDQLTIQPHATDQVITFSLCPDGIQNKSFVIGKKLMMY